MGARVAIFGAGYVGLVTGACFADLGHEVIVRDVVSDRIDALNEGRVPIYEPGLAELIERNRERLRFTTDVAEAIDGSEFVYIAVGTPPTASGDADLSAVWTVIDELPDGTEAIVVMKSTVPVGTGEKVLTALRARGLANVGYVSNPEFTAEGSAVRDFMAPDRIVIGASREADGEAVARLHSGIDAPIVRMDVNSAEMVKLAANAFLSTRISFVNEIANVCELVGADVGLAELAHDPEDLGDRRQRDRRLDRRAHDERPGMAAHVKARADPVGVALLFAQDRVEARVERATQDGVEDRDGVEVGRLAGHAHVANAYLRLRCTGLVDEHDSRTTHGPILVDGLGRRARRAGALSEVLLSQLVESLVAQVTSDDQSCGRGIQEGRVTLHDVGAGQALDGLLDARQRSPVRRRRAEDCLREDALSAAPRVRPRLEQVVHALLAQPLDLIVWERRLENHLGEQRQRRAEMRTRHLHAGGQRLPRRLGVDLRAESLALLDELVGIAAQRPFGHHAAGEHGHATLVGRLRPAAARHQQVRGDEGTAGDVGVHHRQAIGEAEALEAREVVVARRTRAGSEIKGREIGDRCARRRLRHPLVRKG